MGSSEESRNSKGLEDKDKLKRLTMIQGVRLFTVFVILFISILLQSTKAEFLNPAVWIPIFSLIAFSFLINGIYTIYLNKLKKYWIANAVLFVYDQILVTFIIYYTGLNQSVFLFLYLVNIILCGLVYRRQGAIALALFSSILFSFLLIVGPDINSSSMYFVVGLNNVAFFAVAFLSGTLSEQIDFMGLEIYEKGQEILALRDLNLLIIKNIRTGLMTVDLDNKISFANEAAENILNRGALIDENLSEVFPVIGEEISSEQISKEDHKPTRYELQYTDDRQDKLIIEVMVSPLVEGANIMSGFILIFQDLTEVKRLEFAMRQQEKMAAVGQLAAGIAHEIRNPLASISGSIQLLESSVSDLKGEDSKLMKIVLKEIDRLNNLISEFLDYVKPDHIPEDPINISLLLSDVLEIVKVNPNLRQDVEQEVDFATQSIILGDQNKLKQAFLNIVINAYQAMEKVEHAKLSVSVRESVSNLIVTIRDSGQGIEHKNMKRIFEPFHTTKSKGTGLGLAMTHKIFESHQAKIYVESEVGKGTQFIIEFIAATHQFDESAMKMQA